MVGSFGSGCPLESGSLSGVGIETVVAKHAPWKDLERRAARLFGGLRIWRQDFSEVAPDGESETHTWDCKCYQRFSLVEMWVRAERKYREYTKGRRFVLIIFSREHPRAGDFVLVRAKHYAADQAELERLRKEIE